MMGMPRASFFLKEGIFGMAILLAALLTGANSVAAHDGVEHATQEEALKHQLEGPNTLGFPDIKGGDYSLTDHNGLLRSSRDPEGQYQLLFFGYASCKAICSVALPRMAEAVDALKSKDFNVTPVLITVDPERDTVAAMKEAVKHIHPNLVGLTGTEEALAEAYKAFQVEKSLVYEHPTEGPIYAHGSFIYLLGPDGEFKTLFPPVLGSDRIAEVAVEYISGTK
ncbi:MAG: SCO family protein [Stappiaceae bacterium]